MNRKTFDIDIITLGLYLAMVVMGWSHPMTTMGWLSIYTVTSDSGAVGLFDTRYEHGKQALWIGISIVVALVFITLDYRLFETLAYFAYGGAILLLILTLFIGKEVNGAKAWLVLGGQRFQPAEFAKIATALAISRFMSRQTFSMSNPSQLMTAAGIILLPALVVILQNDTGSALVFGSFLLVFYREGLSPLVPLFFVACGVVALLTLFLGTLYEDPAFWYENHLLWIVLGLLLLIGLVYLVNFNRKYWLRNLWIYLAVFAFFGGIALSSQAVFDVLPDHQQKRIEVFFDPDEDPMGAGYNVINSKIAIGSGGIDGKGFLQGNYTKYKFVPKQETDFIFCTVGEEFGWIGTSGVILLFLALIARMQFMAENGKMRFTRVYGYAVLSILFFHLLVNVGMTIGLVPVIGIPLPFFSYGGSALLSFTVLISIMINLYSHRVSVLGRES
ncbi:MAG: rod shape-determining protein RodA [Bacteroidota bacterium]